MYSRIRFCLGLIIITAIFGKKLKIIGGSDTLIEECPYLASFKRLSDDEHMCTGAIISHRHILTAAHCVHKSYAILSDIRIHVGSTDTSSDEGTWHFPERYFVKDTYDAELMGQSNHQLDIAVVKTVSYIEFNEYQNKIDLPTRPVFDGDFGIISSWGATTYPSNLASDILQKTWMTALNNDYCKNIVPFHIYDDQFCAYQRKNVGPCIGDGGTPMISQDHKVIGILTISVPCATGIPDLYTSVYYHLSFIKSIIEDE